MSLHIAIDGPVASGKGTVARLVAERLHLTYIDTGAMYRMAALLAVHNNVDIRDEEKIVELLSQSTMDLRAPHDEEKDGRLITTILNGEDVSWKIRTEEISSKVSPVSTLRKVREFLVPIQQKIAEGKDVIMEGRDITYKVLPNATLKIFLTASPESRAKRRFVDLQRRGQDVTFENVYKELLERDKRDTERAIDPLKIVPDAWVLDTTTLTIEEVVELIVQRAHEIAQKK